GDYGGPLVSKQGGRWVQAGIVSFSFGCAKPNFPAVYTRVSQYNNWINSHITRNQLGFINFISNGTDSDLNVSCTTSKPTTHPPNPKSTLTTTTKPKRQDSSLFSWCPNLLLVCGGLLRQSKLLVWVLVALDGQPLIRLNLLVPPEAFPWACDTHTSLLWDPCCGLSGVETSFVHLGSGHYLVLCWADHSIAWALVGLLTELFLAANR
ncbi:hypothetical protein GOODEAATRI_033270, partial [Goodea atripinnis]